MILIPGNIHGLVDAPQRWWKTFDALMTSTGFVRSPFDVCVHALRGAVGNFEGILCVHVDDTICDGSGALFSQEPTTLRHRFPFRKWQVEKACFAVPRTCRTETPKRSGFLRPTVKITKVPMSPARKQMREDPADEAEIHAFRGVSGSISWLACQTRLDVS